MSSSKCPLLLNFIELLVHPNDLAMRTDYPLLFDKGKEYFYLGKVSIELLQQRGVSAHQRLVSSLNSLLILLHLFASCQSRQQIGTRRCLITGDDGHVPPQRVLDGEHTVSVLDVFERSEHSIALLQFHLHRLHRSGIGQTRHRSQSYRNLGRY